MRLRRERASVCDTFVCWFGLTLCDAWNLHTLGLTVSIFPYDERLLSQHLWECLWDAQCEGWLLPKLRTLELNGLAINYYELWVIMWAHRQTMRSLDLRWIKHLDRDESDTRLNVLRAYGDLHNLEENYQTSSIIREHLAAIMPDCRIVRWYHVWDGTPFDSIKRYYWTPQ